MSKIGEGVAYFSVMRFREGGALTWFEGRLWVEYFVGFIDEVFSSLKFI